MRKNGWFLWLLVIVLFCGFLTPTVVSQEATPLPNLNMSRFADLFQSGDSLNYVEILDLIKTMEMWGMEVPVPYSGDRGDLRGTLVLMDSCGQCEYQPESIWLFLVGANGIFVTESKSPENQDYATFVFEDIPIGNYQLLTGTGEGKYVYQIKFPVDVVANSEALVPEICLAPDFSANCAGNCPVGDWVAFFGGMNMEGAGTLSFSADGTFSGPINWTDEEGLSAQTTMSGTYEVKDGCTIELKDGTIVPNGSGGDCLSNGTFQTTQNGQIQELCSKIDGGFVKLTATAVCPETTYSFDQELLGYGLVRPSKTTGVVSDEMATMKDWFGQSSKGGVKNGIGYDLNDDGLVNAKDLLLLLEQWQLRMPSGPTATPFPTCTVTPTEGGGDPGDDPTPTLSPDYLEGWWEMDWLVEEPFSAAWTSQNNLGEPGKVQSFDMGDVFENATGSYEYNPTTGVMTMHIEGQYTEGLVTWQVSLDATGTLNEEETIIDPGSFIGTMQGVRDTRQISGTFKGYKCVPSGDDLDCSVYRP